MKFTPKTEEEIAMGYLLKEGLYQYRVSSSEDRISNAGNEYTSLMLDIFDDQGNVHIIKTNLALVKLLKHFCDVNNMQEQYKSGNIPDIEFMSKSGGLVYIGIEPEKVNPNGGMYRSKNIVLDYLKDDNFQMKPLPEVTNNFIEYEISF